VTVRSPRFGVWAPVSGTWASRHHPDDPPDASWARNRDLVVEAERLGFDSTLVAQHTVNTKDLGYDQLEAWTAAAGLAAVTERIEIIVAIKPYLYHPVVLAKMALQIEEISQGRLALNLVNAWFKPELERSGIGFADHDDRYGYGREWLEVVRPLLAGETVTYRGEHFQVDGLSLRPASRWRARPRIYTGGESDPARDLVADLGDSWFINGQPLFEVEAKIADLDRRRTDRRVASGSASAPPLTYGLSAFVIARDTDEEALDALRAAEELAALDRADHPDFLTRVDTQAVMFHTAAKYPHVGTNGGTAAGLVGSYDTVARRIGEFADAKIELFMLQFQPLEPEMRRFAAEVLPRIRDRAVTGVAR
jgi:alkanesulfonate monooxygenase